MLFPICAKTTAYSVFEQLNTVLLDFLRLAETETTFGQHLFPSTTGSACFNNSATKDKFEDFFDTYKSYQVKHNGIRLYSYLADFQNLHKLFNDKNSQRPILPDELFDSFKALTEHLFSRSKDLSGVRLKQSITQHYQRYIKKHGKVCSVCGLATLVTQSGKPWRSDYDHLLSQNDYPMYAVHPKNLLPTCYICNQKAKTSQNLLIDSNNNRRLCFYPFSEQDGFCNDVVIQITEVNHVTPIPKIIILSDNQQRLEKLTTWDDVYDIKIRVIEELKDLPRWLNTDCRPQSCDDFRAKIAEKALPYGDEQLRQNAPLFWRSRVYQWLNTRGRNQIEPLWDMIEVSKDDDVKLQKVFCSKEVKHEF